MPGREIAFLDQVPAPLREGLAQLRESLGVPEEFDEQVRAEAERAAAGVRLPERDLTEVPFVTIDPEGSMDLDQALHSLGLQPTDAAPRDWLQRSRAALRLLRLQAAWLVAQLLLALVVILATPWLSLAG